jgi:hypothetical protein
MAQSFLGCDRDQVFLLPPSVDDWLPADHFARFVIAIVEEIDLAAFYADYRADGHGRPAQQDFWYARASVSGTRSGDDGCALGLRIRAGQRSSRVIERACIEDIAFRVIPPSCPWRRTGGPITARSRGFASATRRL